MNAKTNTLEIQRGHGGRVAAACGLLLALAVGAAFLAFGNGGMSAGMSIS